MDSGFCSYAKIFLLYDKISKPVYVVKQNVCLVSNSHKQSLTMSYHGRELGRSEAKY